METRLLQLKLVNFRNHSAFFKEDFSVFNLFIGKNASGKTNILEAIQLTGAAETLRGATGSEMIKKGEAQAFVETKYQRGERHLEIKLSLTEEKNQFLLNGKNKRKADISGIVPLVLFTPDDMWLIKGGAELRRNFIDNLGGRLFAQYKRISQEYSKVLKQRNSILKRIQKQNSGSYRTLSKEEVAWSERMAQIGALLTYHRTSLLNSIVL